MTPSEIAELERISRDIFAPEAVWAREGWRALVSTIPNRRANSAYPLGAPRDCERAIRDVAMFYAMHNRPVRFKVTPGTPASVQVSLAASRLERIYGADVMIMPLRGEASARREGVAIADRLTDSWLEVFCHDLAVDPQVVRWAYGAPGSSLGAASIGAEAVGLGIVRDGWLGVFNMKTRPTARRTGLGRAILDALLTWGRERGARSVYLQVRNDNPGAMQLYSGAGFELAYVYDYWEARDG